MEDCIYAQMAVAMVVLVRTDRTHQFLNGKPHDLLKAESYWETKAILKEALRFSKMNGPKKFVVNYLSLKSLAL